MKASTRNDQTITESILQRLAALNVELTPDRMDGIRSLSSTELVQLAWALKTAKPFNATTCLVVALTASRLKSWRD